ncbi:unnamed protein product [Lymnaea stagnalis]|uniref:Sulfotransferase domain-containing protein n=1 Tax=Lymnaea stagnalis TaxID=6523 RepID=A0AAV2I036_LYMST
MRNFLNCDFESLDEGSLSQPHLIRSPTTFNYSSCLKMPWIQNDTYQDEMIKSIPGCISDLKESCRPAKVTVLKVIEAQMSQAKSLMRSDPKVKVIHLIRDPRGVLSSRRYFRKFNDEDPESFSRDICNSVLEDIGISRSLSQTFPGRVLTVRYEDIAKEPIRVTKQLYRFVGLEMTPSLEKRIWEMTYAGLPDDCNICPVRSNSTETANGWRKGLSFRTVAKIQEECKTLFAVMGYRSFTTEDELKSLHIPTTFDEYDSRLRKADARD